MKRLAFLVLIVLCLSVAAVASGDDDNTFNATLRGINETPGPVATQATGSFHAPSVLMARRSAIRLLTTI